MTNQELWPDICPVCNCQEADALFAINSRSRPAARPLCQYCLMFVQKGYDDAGATFGQPIIMGRCPEAEAIYRSFVASTN